MIINDYKLVCFKYKCFFFKFDLKKNIKNHIEDELKTVFKLKYLV